MTLDLTDLDAHEQPSDKLKGLWKAISKSDQAQLLQSPEIDDPRSPDRLSRFRQAGTIPAARVSAAYSHLADDASASSHSDSNSNSNSNSSSDKVEDAPIYYHPMLPGLLIIPNLLTPDIQKSILGRMIHRDLSDPTHQTNLHLHHNIPYPAPSPPSPSSSPAPSLFSYPPDSPVLFEPKDPTVHKPLSIKQVLERRLHWVTLGGQYDWTNRVYPGEKPPSFPPDLTGFLRELFPQTTPQAAIVNFYTPGDTMMMHRDVSERSDKGLISLSMGCDGLFMITPSNVGKGEEGGGEVDEAERVDADGQKPYVLLRIRSGDAIYMTEESRYAWHGVPKVLKGTCPDYLADWPAEEDGKYEGWKGWVSNKRINLNVRQMDD